MPQIAVRSRYQTLLKDLGLVVVILILASALSVFGRRTNFDGSTRNAFLNADNLVTNVATPMSVYAIMAVGMTVVIITGGIDISVGSIMGLAAILTAWATQSLSYDASAWTVFPLTIGLPILIGLACGLINGVSVVDFAWPLAAIVAIGVAFLVRGGCVLWVGLLDPFSWAIGATLGLGMGGTVFWLARRFVADRSLHPFIVTLSTLSIFRWWVNTWPPQKTMPVQPHRVPRAFTEGLMQLSIHDVQVMPLVVMLLVTAIGALYLKMTVPGVQTYAVGGNEEAAKLSGVRVNAVKIGAYAISGLCAGIAGLVSLGRFETASATTGTGYELSVVAASVVGGASLSGGRGAALGALLGALVIRLIENGIVIMQWNQEHQLGIVGLAILVAVTIDRMLNERSR